MLTPSAKRGQTPKVLAIIVNWNKREYLRNLLGSLRGLGGTPFDIVVVDNASTDGSPPMVREEFPECALVETGRNVGGSGGFNAGMSYGLTCGTDYDFFWLMDNDIVVKPGALDALLQTMGTDERIALVGSAILVLGEEDQVQEIGARVRWVECSMPKNGEGPLARVRRPRVYECDYASACSCLARVSAIRDVGIWDADYFVQMDDIEWGIRLKKRGYRIVATTESQVCHERFDDRRATQGPAMSYLVARNWFYLFWKNAPRRTLRHSMTKLFHLFLAGADNAEETGRHGEAYAFRAAIRDFLDGRRGEPPEHVRTFKAPAPERMRTKPGRLKRIALMAFDNPEDARRFHAKLAKENPGARIDTLLFDPKPYMAGAKLPNKRILSIRRPIQRLRMGWMLATRYDAVAAPIHSPHFIFKEFAPVQLRLHPDQEVEVLPCSAPRLLRRLRQRAVTPLKARWYCHLALRKPPLRVDHHPYRR